MTVNVAQGQKMLKLIWKRVSFGCSTSLAIEKICRKNCIFIIQLKRANYIVYSQALKCTVLKQK